MSFSMNIAGDCNRTREGAYANSRFTEHLIDDHMPELQHRNQIKDVEMQDAETLPMQQTSKKAGEVISVALHKVSKLVRHAKHKLDEAEGPRPGKQQRRDDMWLLRDHKRDHKQHKLTVRAKQRFSSSSMKYDEEQLRSWAQANVLPAHPPDFEMEMDDEELTPDERVLAYAQSGGAYRPRTAQPDVPSRPLQSRAGTAQRKPRVHNPPPTRGPIIFGQPKRKNSASSLKSALGSFKDKIRRPSVTEMDTDMFVMDSAPGGAMDPCQCQRPLI